MGKAIKILLILCVVGVIFSTPSVLGGGNENLLKNPSFEETVNGTPAAWDVMAFDTAASAFAVEEGHGHSGRRFGTITNHQGNDARYIQTVLVNENKLYKVTVWTKTENVGKRELGSNISLDGSLFNSISLTGSHRAWKRLEFYIQTGTGVSSVTVTLGLGGYGSSNTGKVFFDDARMEEVDAVAFGVPLATIGTIDEARREINYFLPPLHLFFDNWLKIVLVCFIFMALGLIFRDIQRKQGLYVSGKSYLLLAAAFLGFFLIYQWVHPHITTLAVQLFFGILLAMAVGYALYLRKTGKWRGESLIHILIFLGIVIRLCYFLYTPELELRQHDVPAHMDYVHLLIEHGSLPPTGEYQMFHPPIHHTITAGIMTIAKWFRFYDFITWPLIGLVIHKFIGPDCSLQASMAVCRIDFLKDTGHHGFKADKFPLNHRVKYGIDIAVVRRPGLVIGPVIVAVVPVHPASHIMPDQAAWFLDLEEKLISPA